MEQPAGLLGLVGDIGGTNARFALALGTGEHFVLDQVRSLKAAHYPTIESAAAAYLQQAGTPPIAAAVVACAGPILNGAVSFTNSAWHTSETALGAAIGLPRAHLINDLAAVAWARLSRMLRMS